jgi:hypothetical protein
MNVFAHVPTPADYQRGSHKNYAKPVNRLEALLPAKPRFARLPAGLQKVVRHAASTEEKRGSD